VGSSARQIQEEEAQKGKPLETFLIEQSPRDHPNYGPWEAL